MRTSKPPLLSEGDQRELVSRSRSSALEHRHVVRAKVVLMWVEGLSIDETAGRLDIGATAVKKWRSRYARKGLEGLKDEPRSGRPRQISSATRAKIVQTACSPGVGGKSGWSQRQIAKECGVSQSLVRDVLRDAQLRPHKTAYWCGKPTDPEFEPKTLEIVGLYLNPPQNALVLCVDEKTGIQALDRTQPTLPMRAGEPKRLTATYKRHGTVSLMAALSVHDGVVSARTIERNDGPTFLAFLKSLYKAHPRKHLHIVLDNLSTHKTPEIKEWLSRRRRIQLHFTPTYSSWLNQVEIWFGILTRDVLVGGVWTSKAQLERQLMQYVKTYSAERAKPFAWTYAGPTDQSLT